MLVVVLPTLSTSHPLSQDKREGGFLQYMYAPYKNIFKKKRIIVYLSTAP